MNDVGAPDQAPSSPVSTLPVCAVPVISGGVVTAGGGRVAARTAAVAVEVAGADVTPAREAVTRRRSVWPMSAAVAVYVDVVAPMIAAHVWPWALQRSQA